MKINFVLLLYFDFMFIINSIDFINSIDSIILHISVLSILY